MQNNDEISPTEKRELLINWAAMIKNECDTYSAELDKKMIDYNDNNNEIIAKGMLIQIINL